MTGPADEMSMPPREPGTSNAIWIDWGYHLRTHSICERLDIELVEIAIPGGRLRRYFKSIGQTIEAIHRKRPEIVYATNPSIVLGYCLLMLRPFYRFKLVTDAHYAGVRPLKTTPLLQSALDFHNRHADMVIVTNPGHEEFMKSLGGHPYVCPDPLPDLASTSADGLELPEKSAFLICSFDHDEPFEAVFEAMKPLQDDGYVLYVSGNYEKMGVDPGKYPWVRFLGFVPRSDYYAHLIASAVVMDFTMLEDCLVCGAYEAMALGKPLVLSDTNALQSYFTAGSVFADCNAESIRDAVQRAYESRDQLEAAAREWALQNEVHMTHRISDLPEQALAVR